MILINFSHPLTPDQIAQVKAQTGQEFERVVSINSQFDNNEPFLPQLAAMMGQIPLDGAALQSEAILVNPPSLNFIAVLVLAELHGRMGYFPPVLRLRPVPESLPPRYEVAEVLNLQAVRDEARKKRY